MKNKSEVLFWIGISIISLVLLVLIVKFPQIEDYFVSEEFENIKFMFMAPAMTILSALLLSNFLFGRKR